MLANSGYVMTLANGIIGVGILAMPFCFQKCGILLATFLLIVSNWITRVCCHYLIKISLLTRRKSFEFLGFHAFGTSGKLLVELCVIGYLLGTCITYFVVVGDLGPQIVSKMFALEKEYHHLRTLLMCGVTVFCVVPLGMLKNVNSLATVCTASIGFYICLVIKIILESETHIMANDWGGKVVYWRPGGVLQCLPIFSMALSCQMQIFEVFTSINNQSLEKLNGIVRNATWICTLVYIAVGFFGYVAFCTQSFSGNILMYLSPSFGSDVIKIGFVLSVAFSFPLVIFPCRASLYSLLYRKGHTDASGYIPESRFKAITIFIVTFSLFVALLIPSVELIIGLVGSTIGVAICIMLPAACFRKIIKKDSTERNLAQFIVIGGFCLMILCTYANLSAIDEKSSGTHLNKQKSDDVIKPTEFTKDIIDEKIKSIEKALEEKDKEKETKKLVPDVKANDYKRDNNHSKIIVIQKPSPPPLPIDESHMAVESNNDLMEKLAIKESKDQPLQHLPQVVALDSKDTIKKQHNSPEQRDANVYANDITMDKKTTASLIEPQPQTIDNDAIKKDEEMAKEEYKQENEELKKTQKELEKTKDLLEKKVEELKEELVKQNQETQSLVAEKLGEVVEKFEAIERKVQKQNAEAAQPKVGINSTANAVKANKGSLVSIFAGNGPSKNKTASSDKILDLVDNSHNRSVLEKHLPPPLAVLLNASQTKTNEGSDSSQQIPLAQMIDSQNRTHGQNPPQNLENINKEALTSKVLQFKSKSEDVKTNANDTESVPLHRHKRSYQPSEADGNCLTKPKVNKPIAVGVSSVLDINVDRELKSVKDEE